WDRLADGRYVSDAYVRRSGKVRVPPCAAATSTAAPVAAPVAAPPPGVVGAWVAPVPGRPGQGFRPPNNPNHLGVDVMEPRNTPIRAASDGVVLAVVCNTSGLTCDVDGAPSVRGCGWYVEVQHPGSVITRYCHLVRQPSVVVGQPVVTGQVLGFVGTSGNSSAPHLHFEMHGGPAPAGPDTAGDP